MQRMPIGGLRDLLATTETVRDDEGVAWRFAHGRQQDTFAAASPADAPVTTMTSRSELGRSTVVDSARDAPATDSWGLPTKIAGGAVPAAACVRYALRFTAEQPGGSCDLHAVVVDARSGNARLSGRYRGHAGRPPSAPR